MEKIDKIRQITEETIKDCEMLKEKGSLSEKGEGHLLMAKIIKQELDK